MLEAHVSTYIIIYCKLSPLHHLLASVGLTQAHPNYVFGCMSRVKNSIKSNTLI